MRTNSVLFSYRLGWLSSASKRVCPGRLRETFSPSHPIGPGPLSESCGRRFGRRRHLDDQRTGGRLVIAALAIDPSTPTTLYAGTSGGGVFKSTDGGGSWRAVNDGMNTPLS